MNYHSRFIIVLTILVVILFYLAAIFIDNYQYLNDDEIKSELQINE